MKVIYKFTLDIEGTQTIQMPEDSEILSVQLQADNLCIWALCSKDISITVPRVFLIYGTGHDIPEIPKKYIATVQQRQFVWHIFEQL